MKQVKNKHRLKQKEIKHLLHEIHDTLDLSFELKDRTVETGKINEYDLIFVDGVPCFFQENTHLFYTLKGLFQLTPPTRYVTVDMGAVKFVTNGADVMAPGIVDADKSIESEDIVWIRDQMHKKPLAVGIAIMNGADMVSSSKGKSVRLVHYIGDRLWNTISKL